MSKKRILIKSGQVCGFADEVSFDGLVVTEFSKTRVSRILPTNPVLRLAFRTFRAMCADGSKLAAWTRVWPCQWKVLIDNDEFGPFKSRTKAIEFEKEKIYQQDKLKFFHHEADN